MEKIRVTIKLLIPVLFLAGCGSSFLKVKDHKEIFKNEEFEKKVSIKVVEAASVDVSKGSSSETTNLVPAVDSKVATPEKNKVIAPVKGTKKGKVVGKNKSEPALMASTRRQPDIEDDEGFDKKRRPLVDPFVVGEKVIHTVSYFGTPAGILSLAVNPYVEVNGRKSYNFVTEIKSSRLFSQFYSVQDAVETFVDYENLVPHVFKLHIKESGQLKEAQSYFDQQNLKADYWENKYTEKHGHEEKKLNWDILPFSQNAFSSIFYMRVFKWTIGKEYAFRVSDDEKNVVFKGKAIQKEKLKTDAGEFNAIKIKAEITARGALSQTGDLYFWISDDDRKFILKIEAKIKIGTLVSEITEIEKR